MRHGTFIWLLCTTGFVGAAVITNPPENVVALQYSSVTLTCGLSGGIGSDYLEWRSHAVESTGKRVYLSTTGVISDSSKYGIDDDYSLTIKSLTIADGGQYSCNLGNDGESKSANVIVITKPAITIDPITVTTGQTATMTCTAHFGSPLEADMDTAEIPKMSMWIGGSPAKSSVLTWSKVRGERSTLKSTGNHTASSGSEGVAVRCRVSTSNPPFYNETTDKLMVKYGVTNIQYVENKKVYYVGETVNCTADAYPLPTFVWVPVLAQVGRQVQGSVLTITEAMIGDNEWTCSATNTITTNPVKITVVFKVEAATEDPNETPEEVVASSDTWKVAVGVVIPIVFICIIAIAVILMMMKRRRNREASEEVKGGPHHTNGGDSGYDEQAPRDAPVTPNPAGYPAYAGPYPEGGSQSDMPQSYPGRNSPGYADLGIRHLNQSNPGVDTHVTESPDPINNRGGYSNEVYDQSPRQQDTVLSAHPDSGSVV